MMLPATMLPVFGIASPAMSAPAGCKAEGEMFFMHHNDVTKHIITTDSDGCDLFFITAGKIDFKHAEIVASPDHGKLEKVAHLEFRYLPKRKFKGVDNFALKVCGTTPKGTGCSVLHYEAMVQ